MFTQNNYSAIEDELDDDDGTLAIPHALVLYNAIGIKS